MRGLKSAPRLRAFPHISYPWIGDLVCPKFRRCFVRDRILGCILGGAIGDAFGRPYENLRPPIVICDADEWRLSDDTQLTLATCEAIAANNGVVDPAVIAERFAHWHRARRVTGMGSSTLKALTELVAGGHWALVGGKGERAAGNGAAMRAAPLAFCLDPTDDSRRQPDNASPRRGLRRRPCRSGCRAGRRGRFVERLERFASTGCRSPAGHANARPTCRPD